MRVSLTVGFRVLSGFERQIAVTVLDSEEGSEKRGFKCLTEGDVTNTWGQCWKILQRVQAIGGCTLRGKSQEGKGCNMWQPAV
mmetsp:Transcript_5820/g.11546  ORF Transcript_5820/g.11546 Transcript_5820/m.11546 type:complete len:83 (+) Transcript_5820:65-313(+)